MFSVTGRGGFRSALPVGVALTGLLCLLLGAPASAQYFGRNKVRYEHFDFRVLQTTHFDIHYYPEEEKAARAAAVMAERWYGRLSRLFGHELKRRQPIVLYASHSHFTQTGIVAGELGEGTGGVTDFRKRRVVLPFAASLAETDHVLGHELVHAFQFDITGQGRPALSLPGAARLPLWFVEGMAEYATLGPVDPDTAMWMREAVRSGRLPGLRELNRPRYFPYRYGHAFWAFVAGRFGEHKIGEVLRAAGRRGNALGAIQKTVGVSVDELSKQWRQALEAAYQPWIAARDAAAAAGRPLVTQAKEGGKVNVGPALSPDGRRLLFLSERDLFSMDLYLADGRSGRVRRRVVSQALDPHFESLQFIHSAGAWDATGRRFAFAAVRGGTPGLVLKEAARTGRTRRLEFPQLDEIQGPSWSPDGRSVAFSAMTGGVSDLFVYDLEADRLERLTEDAFADLQPAWSPDGRSIAFVSDRFTTDLETLETGPYRIAVFERATRGIRPLPGFTSAKNINPQWSSDGASLFFLSDRLGVTNVYRLELASGEIRQVTDLASGVSGITHLSPALSVASRAERLVFSAYVEGRHEIFSIDSRDELSGRPLAEGSGMVAARLPPGADASPAQPRSAALEPSGAARPPAAAREEIPTRPYHGALSLHRIGDPYLAVGGGAFGTFASGGLSAYWSDMLGQQNLVTAGRFIGTNLSGLVGYQNSSSRWTWGLAAEQVPFVSGTVSSGLAQQEGQTVVLEQRVRFRETSRRLAGVLAYPFNRARRLELTAGYRHASFRTDVTTTASSIETGEQLSEEERQIASVSPLDLGEWSAALVHDATFFGAASPILGRRYRFEASATLGSLRYAGLLADYRRYWMPVRPFTIAARALHFGRYGADAGDSRLAPLFLGYQNLVRGYSLGSFTSTECIGNLGVTTCSALEQLLGDRIAVANLELRFPLFGLFGGRRFYGPFPVEMAVFADAGVAWNGGERPRFVGGRRSGIRSVGVALRVNVFGFLIGELDYVRPLDRPEKGARWQLGVGPGF